MHALQSGPLASYNSLQDEHLAEFYSHPRRLRHLRRMGLITKDGDIVDEATLRMNNALKQQKKSSRDALANSVVNKAIEIERQTRIEIRRKLELLTKYEMAEKVKRQLRHPVGVDDGFTPYPTQELSPTQPTQMNTVTQRALRLGIDESLVASYMQTTAQLRKIISMRAPPSPYITKSFSMPIVPHPPPKPKPPSSASQKLVRKKPKTSSCVEVSGIVSRRYPIRSHAHVTMCYVGKSVQLEGSIENDATENKVKPKSWFTFTSRRHKDCPFGISIYLDTLFDCRLSTCCEYRHQPGKMLGSKTSHFGLVKVEGGMPCYKCQALNDIVSPTSMSKTSERAKPPPVATAKESDDEFNVEDIMNRYKTNGTDIATESDNNGSPHNTSDLEDKDIVTGRQQQELPNDNDSKKLLPSCTKDTDSSRESSIEASKRRSVIFSPETKELLDNKDGNRQSLSTSQTINDAKEILKKSNSGCSSTSDSDRSDNEVLSSSSSTDVDMLESRVSQLESGLIAEHTKPESKDTSKLLDDHNSSKQADISNTPKTSTNSSSSSSSGSRSGSLSEVEQSGNPSDQKLLDDQHDHGHSVNALSDNDQLSQPDQSSSHSLDASKPLAGSHSTIKVDHDQQSSKDDQSTPSKANQTNNQQYENLNHSVQDTNQVNNQQSQNNDQSEQQHTKLNGQANQHEEANLSDQGTNQHNHPKQPSESATLDSTKQDHNAL